MHLPSNEDILGLIESEVFPLLLFLSLSDIFKRGKLVIVCTHFLNEEHMARRVKLSVMYVIVN